MNDMSPNVVAIRGRYMHTSSGSKYWPFDPRPEEVDIEVIAHHLSNVGRYGGATQHPKYRDKTFYSVAEHSIYCSYYGPAYEALERLLHDGSEAYIGDLIRPLKYSAEFSEPFKKVEILNEKIIAKRFQLVYPYPSSVKIADEAVTTAEIAQIIIKAPGEEWTSGQLHDETKMWNGEIRCMFPASAKKAFLHRFHQLYDIERNVRRVPGEGNFGCYE